MGEIFLILLLGAILWFWLDSLRAREIALELCRHACKEMDVQLLDQSIALSRLGVRRDDYGTLRIRRWFRFDYSVEGTGRQRGSILMLGTKLENLILDPIPEPEAPESDGRL